MNDALVAVEGVLDVKVSLADRCARVKHKNNVDAKRLVEILNEMHLGASVKEQGGIEDNKSAQYSCTSTGCRTAVQFLIFLPTLYTDLICKDLTYSRFGFLVCISLSYELFYKAILALLRRKANVELMMTIAVAGSALQKDFLNAAMVCVLVAFLDTVSRATLEFVDRRLQNCISVPSTQIALANGTTLDASQLEIGMAFLVRAGEAIPADGHVVKGQAFLDESQVTGEAIPVQKEVNSKVCSGSVVQVGFLEVVADAKVDASFKSRIQDAVRDAKNTTSATQEIVNKFAAWYTPSVIMVAAIVALLQRSLTQFLVIIVAGCPCALLGAAPFVHAATIAALAKRHGFLVKEIPVLESLARMRWLGIDKTGTITTGQFKLLSMQSFSSWRDDDILRWAASVESKDTHPIAQSIVQSYTGCVAEFTATRRLPNVSHFKRQGRCGVMGSVEGHWIGVGNSDFLKEEDIDTDPKIEDVVAEWSQKGTVLFVTVDEDIAAVLLMADALRGDARATVARLQSLGVRPVLLTGDKGPAAHAAATEAGIDEVHFGLLPEEKASILMKASWGSEVGSLTQHLNKRGPVEVGFLGDGLNDCIALANANAGIVMQELGSQATMDAASAVLQAKLGQLPAVIIVARRTQRLVMANITLAMGSNIAVILAAAFVGVPLWLSVLADNAGLLAVLINSLWPLVWRVEPVSDGS